MDTYGFEKGDRVMTPQGGGTVVYRRMCVHHPYHVEVYSVCLDTKKAETLLPPFPSYTGTIYPATYVKPGVSSCVSESV